VSQSIPDIEGLLRQALTPVEPPADLANRLDATLQNLTDLAAEELDAWELASIHDPRTWLRPVVAVGVGGAAGAALVLLRVQSGRKKRKADAKDPLDYAEQTVKAVAEEARRLFDR
jgi:hypothetical protein